jgi:hypothetical protein
MAAHSSYFLDALLMEIAPCKIAYPTPSQSWDKIEEWSLEQRCGMTDTETFFSDQKYLFFHNIYCKGQPGPASPSRHAYLGAPFSILKILQY